MIKKDSDWNILPLNNRQLTVLYAVISSLLSLCLSPEGIVFNWPKWPFEFHLFLHVTQTFSVLLS